MTSPQFAIVVGASSGIGAELVRQLARDGCKVAAVARRLDRLEALAREFPAKVLPYVHDVTQFDEVPGLFQKITGELGGLDLIIYSSGVMPEVGFEEFNFEKDHSMIQVNVSGAVAWINEAANRMQQTRHGSIVAIGSVAGERGRSGQPVYNASKAALATYMEAIRNRVARYGVNVVTVKPGPTESEMTAHLHMKKMSTQVAAAKILRLSGRTGEYFLSPVHKVAFLVIRNFPSFLFRRLKV